MLLECRTCPVRGDACRDCMVSALVEGPAVPLDPRELAFVAQLVGAGLVSRDHARELYARRQPVSAGHGDPLSGTRAG
ncbi:hypothetical protein ACF3NS_11050 [Arsenicicoccus cauae]|uniref:Uncharacterized protein n=1 Tax=Arsenicicoccus cauae TaxID=2663847 RepID=A0A6I3IWL6_9MICO|nr:hypothetical protein [Arsenicicoccus cauae]MTB72869.1 hypothetical protein [Arsenicicoccus cauae]